jgi:hypothetical protein
MGEEFEATQVSCHVEAKIWIGLSLLAMDRGLWINGLFVCHRSIISSTQLGVFWVIRFAAPVVLVISFLSFRSIDNRLALFFILFLPFVLLYDLSSSTAFLTNLLILYD